MIKSARLLPFALKTSSHHSRCLETMRFSNVHGLVGTCSNSFIKRSYASDNSSVTSASDATNNAKEGSSSAGSAQKGGFVRAMAKLEGHESFAKMFRNSPFVQMGDPQGKIAEGTIVHVIEDDLYIDFGFKFNCVCPRPQKNGSAYTLGKKVRIMIHDLELSTRFLGAKTDLTILEADCTLIGILGKQDLLSTSPLEDTLSNK